MPRSFEDLYREAERREEYWVAGAILEFTESLTAAMEDQGVSRAELARRLGVSAAYVTKDAPRQRQLHAPQHGQGRPGPSRHLQAPPRTPCRGRYRPRRVADRPRSVWRRPRRLAPAPARGWGGHPDCRAFHRSTPPTARPSTGRRQHDRPFAPAGDRHQPGVPGGSDLLPPGGCPRPAPRHQAGARQHRDRGRSWPATRPESRSPEVERRHQARNRTPLQREGEDGRPLRTAKRLREPADGGLPRRLSAPSLLFPFLREAFASITSRGRFGPVWLNPINTRTFSEAFKKNLATLDAGR